MNVSYPSVHLDKKSKVFISFNLDNKRIRLFSGRRIGSKLTPNSFPIHKRLEMGRLLCAEVYNHLLSGGCLMSLNGEEILSGRHSDIGYFKLALKQKLNEPISPKYKQTLQFIHEEILGICESENITSKDLKCFLDKYTSSSSFNTLRRHLNVLINESIRLGMVHNPMKDIKSRKSVAKLHKPFKEIDRVLDEVKAFNHNLHLCCLLTYGCLLRPHREIRELTWGDFSEDLSSIHLSGSRNKSGKNRIVPVPEYVRNHLIKGEEDANIFSATNKPLNQDYFKTLWSRFKSHSETLTTGQTLYSFRHSGAIDIFKRTGSLSKLQQAMGHSSLNVSLTYLRGLELAQLTEEDMPSL